MTTHLKVSTPYFYSTNLSKLVEANLISFFDWGFIDYGAYTNVVPNVSGAYGDFSRLRLVNDPNFSSGKVWEGIRSNWVWESGLQFGTPLQVSGIYVNNTFTTSGYKVDYPNGRIIFDTAISSTSIVRVGHSYKEVQFISARDNPLFREIQSRSRTPSDSNFLISSGNYIGNSQNKINLPSVSVEVYSRDNKPYQIGGGNYVNYTAKFHIIGESDTEVSKIADTLTDQDDKIIFAFDIDTMATNNAFPLKWDGTLANGAKSYPDLIALSGLGGYRTTKIDQGKIRMYDCKSQNGKWLTQNIYMNTVSMVVQVIVPPT